MVPEHAEWPVKLRGVVHIADVGSPEGAGVDDPEKAVLTGVVVQEFRRR